MRRLDLMPEGPIARIDRALSLVRHGGAETVVRAWIAGAIPAMAVIGGYWLERVEGVSEFRLGMAALLVAAFALRSVLLAEVSRAYVRGMWEAVELPEGAGQPLAIARTAFVVAVPLALWVALLMAATVLGPFGVALMLPMMALRGLNAPGWLARVACTPSAGLRALREAFVDNAQQRGEGFVVELLLVFAALGVTINLLAAAAFAMLLLRSFLGLELALLDQFLSLRNTFAILGMGLLTAVLLEPLQAALSAIVFVSYRVRGEGLDVRAAIDAATEHAGQRRRRAAPAVAALALLGMLFSGRHAVAQDPDPAAVALSTDPVTTEAQLAHDGDVMNRADRILSGPEYREFDDTRGRGLRELMARLFDEWLDSSDPPESGGETGGMALPLPGPTFFIVMGLVLAVLVAVYLFLSRERSLPVQAQAAAAVTKIEDPRDRAPTEWLDTAAQLAAEGRYRDALRALYLASLVALDRRQLLTFDPTLTNWQYLRQLKGSGLRSDFRELTRIFDHKWYGREDTAEADYLACRRLCERMLASAEASHGEAA